MDATSPNRVSALSNLESNTQWSYEHPQPRNMRTLNQRRERGRHGTTR